MVDKNSNFYTRSLKGKVRAADVLDAVLEQYRLNTLPMGLMKAIADKTNKIANDEANAISHDAPHGRTGEYAKSFTVHKARKTNISTFGDVEAIVYSRGCAYYTHLLEFGHGISDRHGQPLPGKVAAIPHIKPNEEKFNEIYVDSIETLLKRYMGG